MWRRAQPAHRKEAKKINTTTWLLPSHVHPLFSTGQTQLPTRWQRKRLMQFREVNLLRHKSGWRKMKSECRGAKKRHPAQEPSSLYYAVRGLLSNRATIWRKWGHSPTKVWKKNVPTRGNTFKAPEKETSLSHLHKRKVTAEGARGKG